MLANSKLNSIETLISQALVFLESVMKHLKQMLMNEREKYGKVKESNKVMKSGDE